LISGVFLTSRGSAATGLEEGTRPAKSSSMLPSSLFSLSLHCSTYFCFSNSRLQYSTQRKTKHNATQHNTQCCRPLVWKIRMCDAWRMGWDGMEMVWRVVGAEMASVQTDRQTDRPRSLVTDDAENLIIIGRLGLPANILTLACRNIRHGVAVHS
jgi:hypothetical protein